MKQFSKDLGNVSLAPKGKWSREQEYERLNLVYNACDNLSYVAKIDVPSGVDIENREYWQPMNATGYADNNFINLTVENENGTITAYETLEEAVATILPINRRAGATLSFYNLNSDRLDRQAEFELWQFNSTDLANWENRDYWNNIYYNWNVFAGWYVGDDGLKNHVKIPNVGQYAYVGTNLNDALLYQCRTNGTWTNTGIKVRNYISVVVSGNITIGENGNWFSDGEDTGIPATPAVDEQLDNIIMQLQQHSTEIDKLQKQDVVLKSNIDSNFETINNKIDNIKTATDNKIDTADANLQNQITNNDTDITTLNTKHESLSKTVQGIAVTGGASTATNVTYNNDSSGLNAENAQDAIDEVSSIVIYDVSARNNGAIFESIQALLSSSNLSTLIPTQVRHGGMSIRFIQGSEQSSDNKYVQYRLMSQTFSNNKANWQGVDDEPTAGSDNLVKSNGIYESIKKNTGGTLTSNININSVIKELYIDEHKIGIKLNSLKKRYIRKNGFESATDNQIQLIQNNVISNFITINVPNETFIGIVPVYLSSNTDLIVGLAFVDYTNINSNNAKELAHLAIQTEFDTEQVININKSPMLFSYLYKDLMVSTSLLCSENTIMNDLFKELFININILGAKSISSVKKRYVRKNGISGNTSNVFQLIVDYIATNDSSATIYVEGNVPSDNYFGFVSLHKSSAPNQICGYALVDYSVINQSNGSIYSSLLGFQQIELNQNKVQYLELNNAIAIHILEQKIMQLPDFCDYREFNIAIRELWFNNSAPSFHNGIKSVTIRFIRKNFDGNNQIQFNIIDNNDITHTGVGNSNMNDAWTSYSVVPLFTESYIPNQSQLVGGIVINWDKIPNGQTYNNIPLRNYALKLSNCPILAQNSQINKAIISMYGDEDFYEKLVQIRGKRSDQTMDSLTFLWFTDLHASWDNLDRILDFRQIFEYYIDEAIHTGDGVASYLLDGSDFATKFSANILNVVGNHDSYTSAYTHENQNVIYDNMIKPFVSNWDVTQPSDAETNGMCYYYKDYTSKGFRLIVLDCMYYTDEQNTWLVSTLSNAKENNLSVIIASHYSPLYNKIEGAFTSLYVANDGGKLNNDVVIAVDNFISDGGEFVCYITGHEHNDRLWTVIGHNNQFGISVDSSESVAHAGQDHAKMRNTKSWESFNIISFNKELGIIKLMRIGNQYDINLRRKECFCYDYKNHTMLANY